MLPDYTPPTKTISLPHKAGDLIVRGLSFDDVTGLLQMNLPDIVRAVEHYRASMDALFSRASMDDFLGTVIGVFPNLAAQIIATAAGDVSGAARVAKYPMGVQVRAMVAIAEMTLEDMGDLTDPSPALAALVRQTSRAIASRLSPSPGSIGPLVGE